MKQSSVKRYYYNIFFSRFSVGLVCLGSRRLTVSILVVLLANVLSPRQVRTRKHPNCDIDLCFRDNLRHHVVSIMFD